MAAHPSIRVISNRNNQKKKLPAQNANDVLGSWSGGKNKFEAGLEIKATLNEKKTMEAEFFFVWEWEGGGGGGIVCHDF